MSCRSHQWKRHNLRPAQSQVGGSSESLHGVRADDCSIRPRPRMACLIFDRASRFVAFMLTPGGCLRFACRRHDAMCAQLNLCISALPTGIGAGNKGHHLSVLVAVSAFCAVSSLPRILRSCLSEGGCDSRRSSTVPWPSCNVARLHIQYAVSPAAPCWKCTSRISSRHDPLTHSQARGKGRSRLTTHRSTMLSSRTANSNKEYLDTFLRAVGEEKAGILLSQDRRIMTSNTRAFLHSIAEQRPINLTEATGLHSTHRGTHAEATVLIVENIDLKWIATLGVAFNIDSSFFAEHAINPRGATPWKAIFGKWSKDHCKPSRKSLKQYIPQDRAEPTTSIVQSWHIDGVIEHDQYRRGSHRDSTLNDHNFLPRTTAYDETYGWSSSTRISYVLLHPALCGQLNHHG